MCWCAVKKLLTHSLTQGAQPPIFGWCLLWPNGLPSQLLLSTCLLFLETTFRSSVVLVVFLHLIQYELLNYCHQRASCFVSRLVMTRFCLLPHYFLTYTNCISPGKTFVLRWQHSSWSGLGSTSKLCRMLVASCKPLGQTQEFGYICLARTANWLTFSVFLNKMRWCAFRLLVLVYLLLSTSFEWCSVLMFRWCKILVKMSATSWLVSAMNSSMTRSVSSHSSKPLSLNCGSLLWTCT